MIGGAHDRLGAEVEDGADLVLVQHPRERLMIGQVGQRDHAALPDAFTREAGAGIHVPPQRHHALAPVEQPLR